MKLFGLFVGTETNDIELKKFKENCVLFNCFPVTVAATFQRPHISDATESNDPKHNNSINRLSKSPKFYFIPLFLFCTKFRFVDVHSLKITCIPHGTYICSQLISITYIYRPVRACVLELIVDVCESCFDDVYLRLYSQHIE